MLTRVFEVVEQRPGSAGQSQSFGPHGVCDCLMWCFVRVAWSNVDFEPW